MDRWTFHSDMNFDGVLTISDAWLWIKWVFFVPGDLVIAAVLQIPAFAQFFEVTQASYGNWVSTTISAVVWSPFILLVVVAIEIALTE